MKKNGHDYGKAYYLNPPVLVYADFSLPYIVHVDASGSGLGALLYQSQESKERVIANAGRSLRGPERNNSAHRRECIAFKLNFMDKCNCLALTLKSKQTIIYKEMC